MKDRLYTYIYMIYRKISFFINKPKVFKIEKNGQVYYISNTVDITHINSVEFGNNVFIWHNTIIDSFHGVKIGKGSQIGTKVGIFTHSSHNSIRYYNKSYQDIYFNDHFGRIKGSVEIGEYTFVGANSIIMPKTKIGNGCIISGFSYVQGNFPDYSIISGNPAKVIGSVKKIDYKFLKKNPDLINNYLSEMNISSIDELLK
mgnify:CR=1 FL=1